MRFPTLVALTCSVALIFTPTAFAGDDAAPAAAAPEADADATLPAPEPVEMPVGIPDATITAEPETPAPAAAAPAAATDFTGTWANDAAQCAVPQDQQTAPMVLTEKGFDQHETHCAFTNLEAAEGGWKVQAKCSVEGDEQPAEFKLSVKGDTLTMGDEAGSHDMMRCKS